MSGVGLELVAVRAELEDSMLSDVVLKVGTIAFDRGDVPLK